MTHKPTEITVIDVMKSMNIEITPDMSWSVGAAVRERWRMTHNGELPKKGLRSKTAGTGSHCFAVYPREWDKVIREIVMSFTTQKQKQGELFI